MRRLSKRSWIAVLLAASFIMVMACATAPKEEAPAEPAKAEAPAAGGDLNFTLTPPDHWKERPLESEIQVYNMANPSEYNIPNINVSVSPLPEGTTEGEYDAKAYLAGVKASIPGTKRYKVLKQEEITLNDGTKALAYTFTWTWSDGMSKLASASLNVSKDGKFYGVMCTNILGLDPETPDELLEIVKTFQFK